MGIVQVLKCTKCGNQQSFPYNPAEGKTKMPWEVWSNGCPKCQEKHNIDIYVAVLK